MWCADWLLGRPDQQPGKNLGTDWHPGKNLRANQLDVDNYDLF